MTDSDLPQINQDMTNVVAIGGDITQIGHVEGDLTVVREIPAYQLQIFELLSPTDNTSGAGDDLSHRNAPSYLLDAVRQIVPFRGREAELDDLTRWRDAPPRCAIRLMSGSGGQGKSRLANEFARRTKESGWMVLTGVERADTHISRIQKGGLPQGAWPKDADFSVLVIVDYADRWRLDALIDLLRDFEHRSANGRVRVLLLARQGPALWESVASELDRGTAVLSQPLLLGDLDQAGSRSTAFQQAAKAFRDELHASDGQISEPPDLAHSDYGNPLTLHMAALAMVYALAEATDIPTRDKLSVFLLRRERRYWQRMCRAVIADGRGEAVSVDAVARTAFLATLFGPLSADTGNAALCRAGLADSETRAHSILAFHQRFYPASPSEVLQPLRPDRFGEDYIAYVLGSEERDDAWRVASDLASTAVGVAGEFARVVQPAVVGNLAGRRFLDLLAATSEADRHPHLRSRLFEVLESTPRLALCISAPVLRFLIRTAPVDLLATIQGTLPFSVDTLRETAELADRLLKDLPPDAPLSMRAQRTSRVSTALRRTGNRRDALTYAEQSVALYRRLAENNASASLSELANALASLGVALDDMGKRQQALDAIQEAIDIFRRLTGANDIEGAQHLYQLAAALSTLSFRLAETGKSQAGLEASQEAVSVFRLLDSVRPGLYQENLAMSLSNMGSCLSNLDRGDEAVASCQEAVDIYRRLAAGRPAAYLPNLAIVLNNLAARKAAVGDSRSALPLIEEGIAIFRDLADQHPAAYNADLARALDNLKLRSNELGDDHAALRASHEAVETIRSLRAIDESLYLQPLASSIHDLGIQAQRTNNLTVALATMQECVQLRRSLVQTDSAVSPNLAAALRDLGAVLWTTGDHGPALTTTEEAVKIFRQVTASKPELLPHFATSLANYYQMLSAVGDIRPRLSLAEEIVGVYRCLSDDNSHLDGLARALTALSFEKARLVGPSPASVNPIADEAVAVAEEAVTVYARLTSDDPAHLSSMAKALYTLSMTSFTAGKKQLALKAMKQGVDVYRRLAQSEPEQLVTLAIALKPLSTLQANIGEYLDGFMSAKEASEIYDRLTGNDPAYLPELAKSLEHCLTMLTTAGMVGQVEEIPVANKAVDTYRQLADTNPTAYLPRLAVWLGHLVVPLLGSRDRGAAVAAYQEAFAIYKQQALDSQTVVTPDLAEAALVLTILSVDLQMTSVGTALGQEAVRKYQQLAREDADTYLPKLAKAYLAFAIACKESDLIAHATAAAEQSVKAYDLLDPEQAQGARGQREMAQQTLDDLRQTRSR